MVGPGEDAEARRLAAVREAFEECGGGSPCVCHGLQLGRGSTAHNTRPCSLPPGIADSIDRGSTLTNISQDITLYVLERHGQDEALFDGNGCLQWKPRALRRYRGEIEELEPGSEHGYAWVPLEHVWSTDPPVPKSTAPLMPWVRQRTWLRANVIMQKLAEASNCCPVTSICWQWRWDPEALPEETRKAALENATAD